ncbi:cupin domain-containing protein [Paracoccus sp. CPCC 101403]|uniref:Cupin domain-containing protein n=2 Tax=Paracoccus broussonetiae TaxID=3075834 RepID=A0ABU3E9F0_9RHOB|nr:cupin domain-containing protein [Paracoccus sp. CPCC 101403]MDT1060841.1 cupin domain-containing protein [Paracoccus sp. CPCC 101403]
MSLLIKIDPENLPEAKVSKPMPERLIAGDPTFRTWAFDEGKEGRVKTGIWEATPGETHSIKGEIYEFCHLLDGVVELTEEGRAPVIYRKGDSFVMKPGFRGVWKTIETVRKIYVVIE